MNHGDFPVRYVGRPEGMDYWGLISMIAIGF